MEFPSDQPPSLFDTMGAVLQEAETASYPRPRSLASANRLLDPDMNYTGTLVDSFAFTGDLPTANQNMVHGTLNTLAVPLDSSIPAPLPCPSTIHGDSSSTWHPNFLAGYMDSPICPVLRSDTTSLTTNPNHLHLPEQHPTLNSTQNIQLRSSLDPNSTIRRPCFGNPGEPTTRSHVQTPCLEEEEEEDQASKVESSGLRCRWEGCKYTGSFGRTTDLLRHVRTTHVLRSSFTCRARGCHKVFKREDNMEAHFKRIHACTK